jgi:hypothetical protein
LAVAVADFDMLVSSQTSRSMYHASMRLARWLLVLACLLGAGARAAEPRPNELAARLVYERDPAAMGCPDEASLRAAVAQRVGFDPFAGNAQRILVCRVSRLPRGLRARIEIGADGAEPWPARELVSQREDCQELAEALAVALSIAINPLVSPRAPAESAVVPPPAFVAPLPAPPPVAPPPSSPAAVAAIPPAPPMASPTLASAPAARPPTESISAEAIRGATSTPPANPATPAHVEPGLELRWAAAGALAAGLNPGPSYAGDIAFGLAGRRYAVEIGARVVGPSSLAAGRGSLHVWQWALLFAPCVHGSYWSACLLGSAGVIYGRGEGFALTESSQSPALAAGARTAAEYPLRGRRLRLRLALDLTAALTRTHFTVGEAEAWASPRAAVVLGLGLAGAFF